MAASTSYISVGANRSSSCAACCDSSSSSIFAYGAGRYLALWDMESDDGVFATLRGHPGQVTNVKTTATGFISGDSTGNVRIWEQRNNEQWESTWEADIGSPVSALGLGSEDEVYVGGSDGRVRRFRAGAEKEVVDLKGRIPLDLAVSTLPGSAASLLVVGCTDRKIQLWVQSSSSAGYRFSMSLEGHEDWVRCLSITQIGTDLLLASGSQDNYIRLWRISSAPLSTAASGVGVGGGVGDVMDEFEKLAATEEGDEGGISARVHVLSAGSERFNITLDALLIGHESGLTNVNWSQSSLTSSSSCSSSTLRLLSTAADNSLVIWQPSGSSSSTGGIWIPAHRFGTLGGRGLSFFGATWAQGGKAVVATGWNGGVERWVNVGKGEGEEEWVAARGVTGHLDEVQSVAWDPKGDYLLSTSSDQTSRIHARALDSWAEIARPQIHGYDMTDAAWLSPFRFASTADEKVTRVFDATEGFAASLKSLRVVQEGADLELQGVSLPKGATVPPLGLSNRALGKAPTELAVPKLHTANESRDSVSTTLSSLPTEEELSTSTLWPEIEKVYGHGYELSTVSISRSGSFLATACRANSIDHAAVRIVSTKEWKTVQVLENGHSLSVTRIRWGEMDDLVLTVSRDRGWRVYGRKGGAEGENEYELVARDDKAHTRMILDAAWATSVPVKDETSSTSGSYFLTASRDKSVKVWRVHSTSASTVELVDTIKLSDAASAIDVCPSEVEGTDLVAIGTESGGLAVYSLTRGVSKLLLVIDQAITHVSAVTRLAWRPVEKREKLDKGSRYHLATASEDRSVRVFAVDLDVVGAVETDGKMKIFPLVSFH